jgi:hypothetical protein
LLAIIKQENAHDNFQIHKSNDNTKTQIKSDSSPKIENQNCTFIMIFLVKNVILHYVNRNKEASKTPQRIL